MALDAISGATYSNSTNTSSTSKAETGQDSGTVNLNINEVSVPVKSATQTGNEQDNVQKEPTEKQIKDAISKVNSKIKEHRTRCEFTYLADSQRISIKMIDEATDEVIKEIPPEKMVEKMWEMAGILIDERR
jgi:Uncharacterized flagellar protein FlaG